MPRTIVLDAVEPLQVILTKDASGKVIVQAAYRVKAAAEVVKTVPDRSLTFASGPGQMKPAADVLSAQELTAASAAWDAILAALQRLELS